MKGAHILMNTWKSATLPALALATLLSMSACSDPGLNVPQPGQGTGGPATSGGATGTSTSAVETSAPQGGAAARIGDVEKTIDTVACTVHNGQWTMSGGDEEGAKVAVIATEDRATVQSASVVLSDGTLASMSVDEGGSASISWEGETFTVTGMGPVIDLNAPDADEDAQEGEFVITATCES